MSDLHILPLGPAGEEPHGFYCFGHVDEEGFKKAAFQWVADATSEKEAEEFFEAYQVWDRGVEHTTTDLYTTGPDKHNVTRMRIKRLKVVEVPVNQ